MNLSELISAYGDDKVQFQALDACADRMNMAGAHTKITFGTEQQLGAEGTVKMGVVVWMDRDRVTEILAAKKAASTTSNEAGTKAVPVDATDAMIAAALAVDWTGEEDAGVAHNVWHAMVAAAPTGLKGCADE